MIHRGKALIAVFLGVITVLIGTVSYQVLRFLPGQIIVTLIAAVMFVSYIWYQELFGFTFPERRDEEEDNDGWFKEEEKD